MSEFNFEFGPVEDAISKVKIQEKAMEDLQSKTLGYIPKVEGAWRGGDEKEFSADVQRKLIPAIKELIQAIAGFGSNLGSVGDIVSQADSKVTNMVSGLADKFGSWLK
jgi:uncharacterized protein YukE